MTYHNFSHVRKTSPSFLSLAPPNVGQDLDEGGDRLEHFGDVRREHLDDVGKLLVNEILK